MRDGMWVGLRAVAATAVLLGAGISATFGAPATGSHGTEKVSDSAKSDARKADLSAITTEYLVGIAEQRFERVATIVDPKVEFEMPGRQIHGADDYILALKHLTPILIRNDIKKIFVEGDQVCVIYDFVTNTSVGVIPSVEWLTFRDGKIVSVRLIFHSLPWPKVIEELNQRTQTPSASPNR